MDFENNLFENIKNHFKHDNLVNDSKSLFKFFHDEAVKEAEESLSEVREFLSEEEYKAALKIETETIETEKKNNIYNEKDIIYTGINRINLDDFRRICGYLSSGKSFADIKGRD